MRKTNLNNLFAAFSGELAAVTTALCWSFNSLAFSRAGKKVGSSTVNHLRLWIALGFLLLLHALFYGFPFPFAAGNRRFFWLGLSGITGFAIGDAFLFEALVLIGARLSMLLMTLAPVFSTILAWVFLGEKLHALEFGAIVITLTGIAWVIAGTQRGTRRLSGKYWLGIGLGVGGAMGQAAGLLFSKIGMAGGFSPISANLIRVTAAAAAMLMVKAFSGALRSEIGKMKDRRALLDIVSGAAAGPVLGVVLSLYAITHAHMGVAATLMSLAPVILLLHTHFILKEKIAFMAVGGTLLALVGTALLFIVG